jgi:biotin carboxylase
MELAAAVGDTCELLWVVDAHDPSLGSMSHLLPRLGKVIDSGTQSTEETADLLRRHAVDGVIAFTDSQLPIASAIADALELVRNPADVVERLNDKFVQRRALAAAGIDVPGFRLIPHQCEPAVAVELVKDLTFPLVLKPLRGDSSREVRELSDQSTLAELLTGRDSDAQFATEGFIAEEYLTGHPRPERQAIGDYVSVESIVQDGHPVPVALTGKFALEAPFRETGNFMPHPLDAEESSRVLELSVSAALALGVRWGALHTEIKLTPEGPRVIEVNGRIAGGGIDSIFTKTRGYSLTGLAVEVALGRPVDLAAEGPQWWSGPFTYDFFVQPPMAARTLRSLRGAKELTDIEGVDSVVVNKVPGDVLRWQSGSQGYLVEVAGRVADRAALLTVPDTVLRGLELAFD